MAVDAASLRESRLRTGPLARSRALRAEMALGGIVLTSFVARFAASIPHSTPRLFPDEYIYASLARSLAHGRPAIRGHVVHFPALLEPLLAAPLWRFGDVETALRLTQALHALVASLVAVPVYLLARRLGLIAWQRLACSAGAVALPSLVYASYVTADAVGMTLAVTAVYAGVRALETPSRRSQAAFLAIAGLSTFARVQYVILFAAFAAAALVVSDGKPRRALRRYRLSAGVMGVSLVGALSLGPGRVLGYYSDVLKLHVDSGFVRWAANDAMLLVYSSGYVLVPAALVGLALGLARPRTPTERSFAAFVGAITVLLLLETSLYAANGSERFQDRYLIALPSLVPLLFFLAARRPLSPRVRLTAAAFSFGFIIIAARVPLSSYTRGIGSQDSPMLQAVLELETRTSTGTGALVVALVVAALSIPALLAVVRPRTGVPTATAVSLIVLVIASVGAIASDVRQTRGERQILPTDVRWVDHTGARDVSVLVTPSSFRPSVSAHLFWNRSLTRLLQMSGGQDIVDAFGYTRTRVLRDGTILAGGRTVTGSLLVEEYADTATLDNARLVQTVQGASLWQVTGPARLVTLTYGRYIDGWVAWPRATVTVWPHRASPRRGVLCLEFSLPAGVTNDLQLRAPGISTHIELSPGERRVVALPVVAKHHPWMLDIGSTRALNAGGRLLSVQLVPPRFVTGKASATTCR